jgi:hypothetical protein
MDHKENIYKKVEQREKKVGECRATKSGKKTKESYQNSVKLFYLKKKNNWMNTDKERRM